MKPLFVISISLASAIALPNLISSQPASAQSVDPLSIPGVSTQSELLSTESVSLDKNGSATVNSSPSLNTKTLKDVANSIHSRPQSAGDTPGIPGNLLPKDLFRTPSKPISDSHPLEPFQAPPPNPSFGINLNNL